MNSVETPALCKGYPLPIYVPMMQLSNSCELECAIQDTMHLTESSPSLVNPPIKWPHRLTHSDVLVGSRSNHDDSPHQPSWLSC